MGIYDIRTDAPGLLRVESLNVSIKFDRTGPTTGRVSWNIPTPAAGCGATDQAYCGIVITIDNTPASTTKIPTNNILYNSDPTADANLFSGDKIGTSLVIGSFYGNRTTTFFDISGLTPNTPYYVSGFPVDCEYRYYKEGIHSYSLDYTNKGTQGTSGTQLVLLNDNQGVSPNEFTGLMAGINYEFDIQLGLVPKAKTPIDPLYCHPIPNKYTIQVSGTKSEKYADLLNEINKGLALISGSVQGPYAPNTGAFYWDATQSTMFQWDGTNNNLVPAIIQPTAPNIVQDNTFWLNPTTKVLQHRIGGNWVVDQVITSTFDPLNPITDQSYWFDGTTGYCWNGTTWCKSIAISATTDPSLQIPDTVGSYWYDTSTMVTYKWDNAYSMWVLTDVIQYHEDPTLLTAGAFWFDESTNQLNQWNLPTVGWNIQNNVSVSEKAPMAPATGKFWYNPAFQVLKRWSGLLWTELDVISFPQDPTLQQSCAAWWNTSQDQLNIWDGLTSSWEPVSMFFEQPTDPAIPPVLDYGILWHNPVSNQLSVWKNNCFKLVQFVTYPTNPKTTLPVGAIWYNPTNTQWQVLDVAFYWSVVHPVITDVDPVNIPTSTYWFDVSTSSMQVWNGVSWVAVLFSTSSPAPSPGSTWFNTQTNKLLVWNGSVWDVSPVKATVELNCSGNLLFTDTTSSSLSFVYLTDSTLFKSLQVSHTFHDPKPGSDGVSNEPSYNELGVGTDGSTDQRLTLMTEIRYALGYPSVDVELTNEQLDYAITKTIGELRQKSGLGYKRGFLFMQTSAETQRYILNNKTGDFNKIVDIMAIHRLTSSFLASAHGAGVYGQIVLQHLYNMGTFDLLSYHIMTEYTKTMEQLFAAKLTFNWNEQTRELWIHHRFPFSEPYVTLECSVERTEQDLMVDRYARPWIRRYAIAESKLMLAEIRGKFGSLPGAGGSITLNASELRSSAKEEMDACLAEIFDFIADDPGQYGMASTFCFG